MARPGLGYDLIDRHDGDPAVKRRVRLCLATISGDLSVEDARRQLGLSKQAFHDLRERIIHGAIVGGTPRPGGRPPTAAASDDLAAQQAACAALQAEAQRQLRLAWVALEGQRVREELHAVLGGRLKPLEPDRIAQRLGLDPATAAAADQAAKGGRPTPATPPPPPSGRPPD